MSPSRLAALSHALDMPLAMVHRLAERCPQLLVPEPDDLDHHLHSLASELGLSRSLAINMTCHQPRLVLDAKPGELLSRAVALTAALNGENVEERWAGGTLTAALNGENVEERRAGGRKVLPSSSSSPSSSTAPVSLEVVLRWAARVPSVLARDPHVRVLSVYLVWEDICVQCRPEIRT